MLAQQCATDEKKHAKPPIFMRYDLSKISPTSIIAEIFPEYANKAAIIAEEYMIKPANEANESESRKLSTCFLRAGNSDGYIELDLHGYESRKGTEKSCLKVGILPKNGELEIYHSDYSDYWRLAGKVKPC